MLVHVVLIQLDILQYIIALIILKFLSDFLKLHSKHLFFQLFGELSQTLEKVSSWLYSTTAHVEFNKQRKAIFKIGILKTVDYPVIFLRIAIFLDLLAAEQHIVRSDYLFQKQFRDCATIYERYVADFRPYFYNFVLKQGLSHKLMLYFNGVKILILTLKRFQNCSSGASVSVNCIEAVYEDFQNVFHVFFVTYDQINISVDQLQGYALPRVER